MTTPTVRDWLALRRLSHMKQRSAHMQVRAKAEAGVPDSGAYVMTGEHRMVRIPMPSAIGAMLAQLLDGEPDDETPPGTLPAPKRHQ